MPSPPGVASLERLHGAFVSDDEVNGVTDFVRERPVRLRGSDFRRRGRGADIDEDEYDELYDEAVAFVCEAGKAKSSMIQRKFKIGYNRAARIIDVMDRKLLARCRRCTASAGSGGTDWLGAAHRAE